MLPLPGAPPSWCGHTALPGALPCCLHMGFPLLPRSPRRFHGPPTLRVRSWHMTCPCSSCRWRAMSPTLKMYPLCPHRPSCHRRTIFSAGIGFLAQLQALGHLGPVLSIYALQLSRTLQACSQGASCPVWDWRVCKGSQADSASGLWHRSTSSRTTSIHAEKARQ